MSTDERWKALAAGERLAAKMRHDPCAVSDVILQVFEQCSETYEESRGSFKWYFITCLRRELARVRRDVPYEEEMQRKGNSFGHSPLEDLIRLEGKDKPGISDALAKLDADEYDLLVDVYHKGMTLWEIGVKHGIVKQSVWARLQRVLAKLRNEIHQAP